MGEVGYLPGEELFEKDDLAARVNRGLAGSNRGDEEVAGREPGVGVVIQPAQELLTGEKRCFFELGLKVVQ